MYSALSGWVTRREQWDRAFLILLLPSVLFLLFFFMVPLLNMVKYAFYTLAPDRTMVPAVSAENFLRFFGRDLYRKILMVTFRIGFITTLLALLLGYPLAYTMAKGKPAIGRLISIVVISPILVSIVIRTYGWMILLAPNGLLNNALLALGIVSAPVKFIFNEPGVIIGLVHIFLPFMVLPLYVSIQGINPALEEAAMVLGANRLMVFVRVIFPLSVPGVVAGSLLVFTLSVSAYVTPALLGGGLTMMMGTLVAQQILGESHWPLGAAMATILVVVTVGLVLAYHRFVEGRSRYLSAMGG